MSTIPKLLYWILGGLAFCALLGLLVNLWIDYRLPELIQNQNKSDYHITYKDLDLSLWRATLTADSLVVNSDEAGMTAQTTNLYASIAAVKVSHISLWSLLFSNRISAGHIVITAPKITLLAPEKPQQDETAEMMKPLGKIISVSDLDITNGSFTLNRRTKNQPEMTVRHFAISLEGLSMDDKTLGRKIPFAFKAYSLKVDSLYYKPNPLYHLAGRRISATAQRFEMDGFEYLPDVNRKTFVKQLEVELDQYAVKAEKIMLPKLEWGYQDSLFFVKAPLLRLEKVSANIYRNKEPRDNLKKKHFYNKLLRELKFKLDIDSLSINHSHLVYEEEVSFDRGPAVLTFSDFNLLATHLKSGMGQRRMPDVKIKINTTFMRDAQLAVDWKFNVLDKTDGFNIKGRIHNFDAGSLNAFSKPYINGKTKGQLDEVYFNFAGNDAVSEGDFALRYDDFKIALYRKKNRGRENKVLTAIGNLFVKDDSKGKVLSTHVKVRRIPEKSFYNFLWRSIAAGLKDILL